MLACTSNIFNELLSDYKILRGPKVGPVTPDDLEPEYFLSTHFLFSQCKTCRIVSWPIGIGMRNVSAAYFVALNIFTPLATSQDSTRIS
jgi:hypothetical protein